MKKTHNPIYILKIHKNTCISISGDIYFFLYSK